MSSDYGPSLTAAKLYERTSAKGVKYFSGYMGVLSVALFRTEETSPHGESIWVLKISEARKTPRKSDESATSSSYGFGGGAQTYGGRND